MNGLVIYTILISLISSGGSDEDQPKPCDYLYNDCNGYNYCHIQERICKPYGNTTFFGDCTENTDCRDPHTYCKDGHCQCLFTLDEVYGADHGDFRSWYDTDGCPRPKEGTICRLNSYDYGKGGYYDPRRGRNEVQECQGALSRNFRCHPHPDPLKRGCYCQGESSAKQLPYYAPKTRKQDIWFNNATRKCEKVPKEGSECTSDDSCQTKDTKLKCIDSVCRCPKNEDGVQMVQYSGVCNIVEPGDYCQEGPDGTAICPGDNDLNCVKHYQCVCKHYGSFEGKSLREPYETTTNVISGWWSESRKICAWESYGYYCYYRRVLSRNKPNERRDNCQTRDGLTCNLTSYRCECDSDHEWEYDRHKCVAKRGRSCVNHDDCVNRKCESGICAKTCKSENFEWSDSMDSCVPKQGVATTTYNPIDEANDCLGDNCQDPFYDKDYFEDGAGTAEPVVLLLQIFFPLSFRYMVW